MPSSVIRSFYFNPDKQTLTINFVSGFVYTYYDVSPAVYDRLKRAKSKGVYFNRHIKDHYVYKKQL